MHWSHKKGLLSEEKVRLHLEGRGCRLIRSRFKTPYAEIDLLMRSGRGLLMVEVKSLSTRGFLETRLSRRQKERLHRAREWLAQGARDDVSLILAVVEESGKILLFNLSENDLR
ncbi:MAG TPA: YraN family protein [Pseudobdellovibrionaceae bacterium]|nr:YraN family protein [Pseudobdellovibrionaceae bacterium]